MRSCGDHTGSGTGTCGPAASGTASFGRSISGSAIFGSAVSGSAAGTAITGTGAICVTGVGDSSPATG